MQINLDDLNPGQVYGLLTQSVIPRPIAWVLSESRGGSYNLAPFSYFIPLCSNPPLVALSVGWKDPDTPKDTARNIEERDEFVIHIVHREMLNVMNASAAGFDHDVSEVTKLGLETTGMESFRLPRLKDARIALACRRHSIQYLGPGRQHLIIGQIEHVYIDDDIVEEKNGRLTISPTGLNPVARLGPGAYATLSDIISLRLPT